MEEAKGGAYSGNEESGGIIYEMVLKLMLKKETEVLTDGSL